VPLVAQRGSGDSGVCDLVSLIAAVFTLSLSTSKYYLKSDAVTYTWEILEHN